MIRSQRDHRKECFYHSWITVYLGWIKGGFLNGRRVVGRLGLPASDRTLAGAEAAITGQTAWNADSVWEVSVDDGPGQP